MMAPRLRKFVLTAHVVTSVGWLGAVIAFLALAVVGLTSGDVPTVRAAYMAAEPITRYALVPLALASLAIGVIQSLGTKWGLFRHYWVIAKLVLTVLAAGVLLQYTATVALFADIARSPDANVEQLRSPTFLVHAAGGLVLLVVATVLSVYKPAGLTRRGWRKHQAQKLSRG